MFELILTYFKSTISRQHISLEGQIFCPSSPPKIICQTNTWARQHAKCLLRGDIWKKTPHGADAQHDDNYTKFDDDDDDDMSLQQNYDDDHGVILSG